MKIQGPNHSNFNPYQKQIQKQHEIKQEITKHDKVQISNQAKQLQENTKPDPARLEKLEALKKAVDAGTYQVDAKETAKKMLDFWSNKA
ncbi:flagellar biosynthesis anti-sigma factor FlgM [Radiobacillus kanasensis]|uniref:flagellar biosynthesis anti-sigma factor FlgM n=1 Tax=Radiobacillus kanasensis TaxID=2844358 RepID=UPI001E53D45B|nr:flagellar biosynthesis anti-sigma factor FlgM [Radiobacillus kanasensis]UFT98551.1 flagellar biosynthesis anti-sigma factor FlgM [Radiobacillus kanasensis]